MELGVDLAVLATMPIEGIEQVLSKADACRLYELPAEEAADIQKAPATLDEALNALEEDHEFLLAGDVFTEDFIGAYTDYKKSAEMNSAPNIKKLALEYLVAAYGPDKLNDPAQSEPIVEQMIQLEPKEPTNYYVLAKMYEDSGQYELAEQTFDVVREIGSYCTVNDAPLAAADGASGASLTASLTELSTLAASGTAVFSDVDFADTLAVTPAGSNGFTWSGGTLSTARAVASSPSGCSSRLNPIGARNIGMAKSQPRTLVRVSKAVVFTALRGRKRMSFQLRRFSRRVTSPSAPPST